MMETDNIYDKHICVYMSIKIIDEIMYNMYIYYIYINIYMRY